MSPFGVDAIILRVFSQQFRQGIFTKERTSGGSVYFKTSRAPVKADILSLAVEEARRNGIKIFAWMTTWYADYGIRRSGTTSLAAAMTLKKAFSRGAVC